LLRRCARVNQGNNPENKAYHYKKTNGVHATTCQAQPEVHDTPLQSWRGCYFFGLLPEYPLKPEHLSAGDGIDGIDGMTDFHGPRRCSGDDVHNPTFRTQLFQVFWHQ